MDLYEELLLSALISLLLAFLLSSLSSSSSPSPQAARPAAAMASTSSSGEMGNTTPNPNPSASEVVEIERVVEVEEEEEEEGWEKFERSEAEERFREAAGYMASEAGKAAAEAKARGLDGATEMRLFALHKVATEGPCREPPPMALKLAARARWNAWQRLGSMNPEAAMEQYVALVSQCIPGWAEADLREEAKDIGGNDIPSSEMSVSKLPDFSSTLHPQQELAVERLTEGSSFNNVNVEAAHDKQSNQGLTKTFIFNLLSPTRVTFST